MDMSNHGVKISKLNVHLTMRSGNGKIGPIPASTTSAESCPPTCPLMGAGCYGEGGPQRMHWDAVSRGKRGMPWGDFVEMIRSLPLKMYGKVTLWRHDVTGDLPHTKGRIDGEKVAALAEANGTRRGFTYTHHLPELGDNGRIIKSANDAGFTINLSGNNPEHADYLYQLNIGPVVSVIPKEFERKKNKGEFVESLEEYRKRVQNLRTPDGVPLRVCPATFLEDMNCANCGACAVRNRKSIIAFPAHGFRARKADAIARGTA